MSEPVHSNTGGRRPPPRERRKRRTPQQSAVLDLLNADSRFRSAQQLYFDLHDRHQMRVALTTVYRVLQTFAHQNIVESQRAEDGEILYRRRTDNTHHHNLLCRGCGRAIRFDTQRLEDEVIDFATEHGFIDVSHRIDLYGTCPQCTIAQRQPG